MARPKKKGIDYFPLDVKMDDEITLILAKHGAEGFGILVILWQIIYNNGFYIPWTEKELLLYNNRFYADSNKVNDVINECLKWDIFNSKLYEKYNILTSEGIQKRYVEAVSRRESVFVEKEYWLLGNINAHINLKNADNNSLNEDNNPQSKVKKSKVNHIIEHYKTCLSLPQPQKITDKRRSNINARLEDYGYNTVIEVIDKAEASSFLSKSNKHNWLNFDWIFNPNNFVKILEDKYTDEEGESDEERLAAIKRMMEE